MVGVNILDSELVNLVVRGLWPTNHTGPVITGLHALCRQIKD